MIGQESCVHACVRVTYGKYGIIMGIYSWDLTGTHAYTRKVGRTAYEAIIDEPEKAADSATAAHLLTVLESQGYTVTPADVPQEANHVVSIAGVPDKAVQERLTKRLVQLGFGDGLSSDNGRVTVSNIPTQEAAKELQRALGAGGFTKESGYTIAHEDRTPPAKKGIHVRGISNENAFLAAVEGSGWSKGERRDEYHGMNPLQAGWSKMMKGGARRWAAAFILAGDTLLGKFVWQEAMRLKGPDENSVGAVMKHSNFKEFIGFWSGSLFLFLANPKDAPTVPVISEYFKRAFRVGDAYDFSLNKDFTAADISSGHIPDTVGEFAAKNGHQILLTGGIIASKGIYDGQNSVIDKLASSVVQGGASAHVKSVQNVVLTGKLDDKGRQHEMATRFKIQDWFSGVSVGVGSTLGVFVPQKGMEHPAFNYPNIVEKLRAVPVLGGAVGLAESFSQTVAGKTLFYLPNKLIEWVRTDPFYKTGQWFKAHNLGQIFGGAYGYWQIGKEMDALTRQFTGELAALRDGQGYLTPPAGQGQFKDLNPDLSQCTLAPKEIDRLKAGLEKIYNGEPGYTQYIDNYKTQIKERHAADPSTVSPVDAYLALKATNRVVLDKRSEEHGSFFYRAAAYFLNFIGNTVVSFAGEGHTGRPNYSEKTSNLFASCEELAKVLKENNAVNDTAIGNAAKFIYAQAAFRATGLGEKELAGIIGDYAHGRVPEQVNARMAVWKGASTAAQEAAPEEASPEKKFARDNLHSKMPEYHSNKPEEVNAHALTGMSLGTT